MEKQQDTKKKKENKFVGFIKKHKVLSFIMGAILLFSLTIGITYFGLKLTAVKDVQIPNLANLSQQEAKKTVEDLKLVYQELEAEYSPEVPEGYVMRQDPAYLDNYKIKEKTIVKVVISKGQEITTVPKVVGKTKEEAIALLEEAKLKPEVVEESNKKVEEGYVISQELEANKQVNAGEIVKIHVSTGLEQVTVPNVVGKTEEEAKKAIIDAKLKVKQVLTVEDASTEKGKVIKQDLQAGTTVNEDTEMIITVNTYEETKKAKITINVKAITKGYEEEKDNKIDNTVLKTVTVKLLVNDKVVFSEGAVDKNKTDLTTEISGKGKVELKLQINNGEWTRTETIDLNTQSAYTFK